MKMLSLFLWKLWMIFMSLASWTIAYDPFMETKARLTASTGPFADDIVMNNATDENGNVVSTLMTLHGVTLCMIGYDTNGTATTMIVFKDETLVSTASYNTTTHTSTVIHYDETGTAETKYVETFNTIKNRAVRQNFNSSDVVAVSNVLFYDSNGTVTRSIPAPTTPVVLPLMAFNLFRSILEVLEMSISAVEPLGFVMRIPMPDPQKGIKNVMTVLIGVPVYVTTFTLQGNVPVALTIFKHHLIQGRVTYNPLTFDSQLITFDETENIQRIYTTVYDVDLRISEMIIATAQGSVLQTFSKTFDENGNPIAESASL